VTLHFPATSLSLQLPRQRTATLGRHSIFYGLVSNLTLLRLSLSVFFDVLFVATAQARSSRHFPDARSRDLSNGRPMFSDVSQLPEAEPLG